MTAKRRIATETEVRALSFYSLCQIAERTGYADPIGAVLAGRAFDIEVDALGNVIAAATAPSMGRVVRSRPAHV